MPCAFWRCLVVATPCPLLIAIPVTIIGAISLAARRGIIIKDPAALEQISDCQTAIFDKTGTLTYGQPQLVDITTENGFDPSRSPEPGRKFGAVFETSAVQRDSRCGQRARIVVAAKQSSISEEPGRGLRGRVSDHDVMITGRKGLTNLIGLPRRKLPPPQGGLECMVVIDGRYAATLRFRDEPRGEGASFIAHLRPKHDFRRLMLVSGDRDSEVRYLADRVGITEVYASQSPEQKLEIVRRETARGKTVFLGDGINDAPA